LSFFGLRREGGGQVELNPSALAMDEKQSVKNWAHCLSPRMIPSPDPELDEGDEGSD